MGTNRGKLRVKNPRTLIHLQNEELDTPGGGWGSRVVLLVPKEKVNSLPMCKLCWHLIRKVPEVAHRASLSVPWALIYWVSLDTQEYWDEDGKSGPVLPPMGMERTIEGPHLAQLQAQMNRNLGPTLMLVPAFSQSAPPGWALTHLSNAKGKPGGSVVTGVNVKEHGCWKACSPVPFLISILNMWVFSSTLVGEPRQPGIYQRSHSEMGSGFTTKDF